MKLKNLYAISSLSLIFLLLGTLISNAQDPTRFKNEVEELTNKTYNFSNDKKLVVFTGSSSIRTWKDVQSYFPDFDIINNGFGGSQFSDLLYFYNEMIIKPKPEILFIYEGDNDLASNKKPGKILKEAKQMTGKIQKDLPKTCIVFISPKPSIARVQLKNKYITLNNKLERFCNRKKNVDFVNVWTPMHDKEGKLYQDIFLEDGLHMNKKGYDIWGKVIGDFLKN